MHLYAIALGSNCCHGRHGSPRQVIDAAFGALEEVGRVAARSPTIATAALGPAGRHFANAAALIATDAAPPALLAHLKRLERDFGRRRGRRWGARVLDLDILLWSGGAWRSARPALAIPHPRMAERDFALRPLAAVARDWRVPRARCRVRHLAARLTRAARLPTTSARSGP